MVELTHDRIERTFGDDRVTAERVQDLPLLLQVLEQIGLEVCARTDVHDFEDGRQCVVVVQGTVARY